MERQGSAEAIAILILTNVKYQIHVVTRLVFVAILMVPMSKFSEILKCGSFFFRCKCNLGFKLVLDPSGDQRCEDINECEVVDDICGDPRLGITCINQQGGFR